MYLLGHLGVSAAAYVLVRRAVVRRRASGPTPALVGLLALTMAPDVDLRVAWLAHRGLTHTVWFAILVGVAAAMSARAVARCRGRTPEAQRAAVRGFVVGTGAVASHLAADVVTPMGIRPLAPLSDHSWTLSLVAAADPSANAALFASGAAILWIDRADLVAAGSSTVRRAHRRLRAASVRRRM